MLKHEALKKSKLCTFKGFTDVRPAHVIYNHRGWQLTKEVPKLRQINGFKINNHMPTPMTGRARKPTSRSNCATATANAS